MNGNINIWNIRTKITPERYTTNLVFYTSGNRFVRRTGTFGNLTFSLVPSDNRNTRSPCPTSVFTGIGQTLMSRPALLHFNLCRASEGMTARKHVQFHFNYSNCEHHWRNFIFPLQVSLCQWFSPVSSTNKTDRYDKTEILLKVALNTIKQTNLQQRETWSGKIKFLQWCSQLL
jgi:hypothetical protein